MGKVSEWSKVARWERWENSEVAWSERWECNGVAICERREGVSREDGIDFKDKIVLYWNLRTKLCCIAPEKRNASRDSLQRFHKSYLMFWMLKLIK